MTNELPYYWIVEYRPMVCPDRHWFWRAAESLPPFETRREAREARDRLRVQPVKGTLAKLRSQGIPTWRPPRGSKLRVRKFKRAKR